jgi:methyltransferase (TIGR00027 family)
MPNPAPNPAAATALGPLLAVATEQYIPPSQRLIQDDLAYRFLPTPYKIIASLTRWPALRKFLFKSAERRGRGVWGGVLCRKRYIDDRLSEALNEGIQAVVNLGAGLDTRLYRLPGVPALPAFEIDLPENIAYKKRILERIYGKVPAHVRLVPVDFSLQDLGSALVSPGYDRQMKTFFIWEAVTQYLPEPAIRKTFEFLSQAQAGSRLAFTYILQDFIAGRDIRGVELLYREYRQRTQLWQFGFAPEQVPTFLSQYSWAEVEQVGEAEYTARYLQPFGRPLPVMEIERMVYAQKIDGINQHQRE